MKLRNFMIFVNLAALWANPAMAHVSEQGFVLLLSTGAYISAGVAVVALTVIALFAIPERVAKGAFAVRVQPSREFGKLPIVTSLLSFCLMCFGIYVGVYGPRDPLSNLMPLGFWTIGWIALVSVAAFIGNIWTWVNPWMGLYRLLGTKEPVLRLPDGIGVWPAMLTLVGFAAFLLADPAPDDPARLAQLVAGYWAFTFTGLLLFGPKWCHSAELGHVLFAAFASMSPLRWREPAGIGCPGWQIAQVSPVPAAGLFALTMLGVGSFDGLNETFWWLGQIGLNPLEFPGRSAIIGVTLLGLVAAILGLMAVFALVIWMGMALAQVRVPFSRAYGWLALCVLPIALVYHMAHYLTAFLVSFQYTIAAISDPFATGADYLGIQPFRVTTGFFNRIDTVRLIWITQAGLVVVGHVWSVLLAHRVAITLFGDHRRAAIATLPLSVFMIGYTFLGLWLLAAPKGA